MKFYVARSKKSGNFVSFTHIVDDQGDFSDNIPMESFQRGAMPFMWMEKEIAKLCDSVFPGHNLKNDIEFIPISIEFLKDNIMDESDYYLFEELQELAKIADLTVEKQNDHYEIRLSGSVSVIDTYSTIPEVIAFIYGVMHGKTK